MKKALSIILALVLAVTALGALSLSAFAQETDTPPEIDYHPIISMLDVSNPKEVKSYRISNFDGSADQINPPEGVSYDYSTDTMTLDNFKNDYVVIQVSGGPLTVNVIGECSFQSMIILSSQTLTFSGDGDLTVNRLRRMGVRGMKSGAVDFMDNDYEFCPKIIFSKDVTCHFYGSAEGGASVRVYPYKDYPESSQPYAFQNGKTYDVERVESPDEVGQEISGFFLEDRENIYEIDFIIKKADDPSGIYAGHYGTQYYDDTPGYFVQKYLYSEKYQTYLPDPDFYQAAGAYGSDDIQITRFQGLFYSEALFESSGYSLTDDLLAGHGYLDQWDFEKLHEDADHHPFIIHNVYDEEDGSWMYAEVYACVEDEDTGVVIFEKADQVSADELSPVTKTYYDYYYYLPNEFHYLPSGDQTPTEEQKPTEQPTEAPDITLGDTDGDGVISVLDATRIQKHKAKLCNLDGAAFDGTEPTAAQLLTADVDQDGVISVLDATRIQKYKARLCSLDGAVPYHE